MVGPLPALLSGFSHHGWTVADVSWGRFAEVALRRGDRTLQAWIAPAGVETGCFRQTASFKVGYRGDGADAEALGALEALADRLRDLESRLAPGEAVPWPGREAPPDRLVVSDGVLELRVTLRCNERCAFCNSADWVENRVDEPGAVDRALAAAPALGAHTVHFTGGEPTLARELPDWVVAARRAGLRAVVQTNALGIDDERFFEAFRDGDGREWLPDLLFVSFHTRHPDRVQALTGVGGTLPRKVAGIRRALARGVPVHLNFVIQAANLDELDGFPAYVSRTFVPADREGFPGIAIVFSVVAPTGRSSERPDLWPSMRDLAPRLARALDASEALGVPASVPEACGVPVCVLPDHARFFEATRRDRDVGAPAEDRVKAPGCSSCALERRCVGIWRRYAEVRGTVEFVPVRQVP